MTRQRRCMCTSHWGGRVDGLSSGFPLYASENLRRVTSCLPLLRASMNPTLLSCISRPVFARLVYLSELYFNLVKKIGTFFFKETKLTFVLVSPSAFCQPSLLDDFSQIFEYNWSTREKKFLLLWKIFLRKTIHFMSIYIGDSLWTHWIKK